MPATDAQLVIITGPVGAGKSTVAQEAAKQLRAARPGPVAVIDLDVVFGMLKARGRAAEDTEVWGAARRSAGNLAASYFENGFSLVLIEGEFFEKQHFDQLRAGERKLPPHHAFTLEASFPAVLIRVAEDPSRGLLKDPEFLKDLHNDFTAALPYLDSVSTVLDAEERDAESLAQGIVERLAA